MYKVEIKIGDGWGFDDEELLVIETTDFEKAQIIQEFIEFQKNHGWAVEYDVVTEFDDEEDEDENYVYDEESDAWYWYDEEADVWYVHDEESDDWIEYTEDEVEEVVQETVQE